MTLTFPTLIQDELTRRLTHYAALVDTGDMDKDTANHRYLALQHALWMHQGGEQPKATVSADEARAEIQRWIREINRNATVKSIYIDGRKVKILQHFLDTTKPITAEPVQLNLI